MDTALQTVATEQATLGSYINRLNFNTNLSKSSVMTEQAIGRIVDADFATEKQFVETTDIKSGCYVDAAGEPVKAIILLSSRG